MAGTLEYELLNKNLEMVDGHAVKAPEDYQNPEQLYEALIARVRKYHPSADISLIEKAYKLSREAHKEQVRKSGEPYIIHPLWVGIILADLEMDKETIVAGMLHDTVEDTEMTVEDISARKAETLKEALTLAQSGVVAVLADPTGACIPTLRPGAVVDAILAKKNLGTALTDAPVVIGVGPGFTVGTDCHAAVETMRGHTQIGRAHV